MINKEDCSYIGLLTKIKGTKGSLILRSDQNISEKLFEMESVFIDIDNGMVPFFLSKAERLDDQNAILSFQDINDNEKAVELKGKSLYAFIPETEKIPSLLELIGFIVYDTKAGKLGTITDVIENPKNPLIEISPGELLIPFQDNLIISFDPDNKTITFSLPEGLVDGSQV